MIDFEGDSIVVSSRQHLVTRVDYARYHGAIRELSIIDLIAWHATAGAHDFATSRGWLNRQFDDDGKTPLPKKKRASYHYGIDRDGSITRMLPIHVVAFGCGDSAWPNPIHYPPGNGSSVNVRAISVAWANDDKGEQLTDEQIVSGLWLGHTLMGLTTEGKNVIPPSMNAMHYEISPGRKGDPRAAMTGREWRQMLANVVVR